MPHLSLQDFRDCLLNSGLISEEELDVVLPTHEGDSGIVTAEALARQLIKDGLLTTWQARQIYRGSMRKLVLGNYILLDKLGQGGMGMVFKAEHRVMQRIVALKTLSPHITKSSQLVARFHREVQVAARLDHPNIVTAYDAANEGEMHYLVMQYVEGNDLASLVRRQGVLKVSAAIGALRQAASGLQYAHEQGVIHRDIKPSNMLIDANGTVRILDMGLARLESHVEKSSDITASGTVMGTIDYMSPEQAENTRQADARSDVYSLGCTLYFLLTGRPAFGGNSVVQRILAHRDAAIPQLTGDVEHANSALENFFQRMIAKNPDDRYQSMAEVIQALDQLEATKVPPHAELNSPESQFNAFLFSINSEESVSAATRREAPAESFRNETSNSSFPVQHVERLAPLIVPVVNPSATKKSSRTDSLPKTLASAKSIGGVSVVVCLLAGFFILFNRDDDSEYENRIAAPDVSNLPQREPTEELALLQEGNSNLVLMNSRLRFDGEDDYVVVPNFSLNDSRPVTLEAWLTPHSASITANPVMLMGTDWMTLYQTGPDWGVGKLTGTTSHLTQSANRIETGRRVHLAGVWDGTETRLYLSGEQLPVSTSQFQLQPTFGGLFLGGAPSDQMGANEPDRFFQGEIHQVRISAGARYSGNFTPDQILVSDEATTGLYLLNEGTGNELRDHSGNERHGTIHGATWLQQR